MNKKVEQYFKIMNSRWIKLLFVGQLLLSCNNSGGEVESTDVSNKGDGVYTEKHDNGNVFVRGFLKKGLKEGVWKYYQKDGSLADVYLFSEDSLLFELDKDDFIFSAKSLNKHNASIEIPIKWEVVQEKESSLLLTANKLCGDSMIFCPNLTVVYESIQKSEIKFEEYIKKCINLLEQKFPYFKLVAAGDVSNEDHLGYQITYLMLIDNVKLGGITTWINNGSDVYIITGMASNEKNSEFLKYKSLFQEITSSFSLN